MTKTVFAYVLIIIFIGLGVWLFVRKVNDAPERLLVPPTATPTSPLSAPTGGGGPASTLIKMENGLQVQDLKVGTGPEAKTGFAVAVNYLGTLENGTKFDSSYDRGQPFQFVLGAGQVIKGWDIGVVGMKVGGKRKLVIPPALAYGEKGIGPIPPNSTLVFEVELLAVQAPPAK